MSRCIRWISLWGAALILLVGAVLLVNLRGEQRRLKVENFSQVALGMSLKEVEDLLGGPAGNYGLNPLGKELESLEGYPNYPGTIEKQWCNENHMLEIYFDAKDQVAGFHKRASYKQYPPESWLSRVWRFFGISGSSP